MAATAVMHGSTASQDGKRENDFDAVGVACKWPAAPGAGAHYSAAALSGHVAVGAGTLIWRDLQKFQRDITEGRPAVN